MKVKCCELIMDTASVEVFFGDGTLISVYCPDVEDDVAHTPVQRGEGQHFKQGPGTSIKGNWIRIPDGINIIHIPIKNTAGEVTAKVISPAYF